MKDLLNCLDNEIQIYEGILLLVEEEKRILVKNEELRLEEIVKKQDQFIKKIDAEEKERIRLIKKLTEKEKMSSSLKDRIERIKSLIIRISEINNSNVFLIKQGQNNIKAFLELILEKNNSKSYSSDGRISNRPGSNIFINKTI